MQNHKTDNLELVFSRDPSTIDRIARVAAIIHKEFLSKEWERFVREGSITFQEKNNSSKVLKLFIDLDQKMADKTGVIVAQKHPIVLGLEVESYVAKIEKEIVRNWLQKQFGDFYLDPRNPKNELWTLRPIYTHEYDIVFLKPGVCNYPVDEKLQTTIQAEIEKIITNSQEEK